MLNTCPHRGAQVCREKHGSAKSFQCFYHGWVFGLDGTLRSQPGESSYAEDFKERSTSNMQQVARFESYRDLNFICFDKGVESLSDYLGPVKKYLDVICDQAETGMTIVGGTQEYSMRANWKLLTENSIDGYHALTTHATYLDYLKSASGALAQVPFEGSARDLGKGHAVLEYKAPWGRPVAQWIPSWGEEGKRELSRLYDGLVTRFGKERADRIATFNRNLFIFPESRDQRHHGGDGPNLLSRGARLHEYQRLGSRAQGRDRLGTEIPAVQLPRIPRARRLRDA